MPKLNKSRVKHRMAELGITSAQLASDTDIPWGSLRNALAGRDQITLVRVYALGHALAGAEDPNAVTASIVADDTLAAEILANNDGVPDEPPTQPKRPAAPPPRRPKERTGPKRAQAESTT
jgi:hypothetical protein